MTHTLPQPFARINTPAECRETDRHAPQIVPVIGNADRSTPVFLVLHGPRHHLTADGRVTTTPVWLTWTEAVHAEQLHADTVELARTGRPALADVVARAQASSHTDPTWRADYRDEEAADEVAREVDAGRACGLHDRPLPCLECSSDTATRQGGAS